MSDIRAVAAKSVAVGGWSAIYDLILSLPDDFFEDHFSYLYETEDISGDEIEI